MREWVANRTYHRLVCRSNGVDSPPTSQLGVVVEEPDGSQVLLSSNGDSFDLAHTNGDKATLITLTPRAALHLAWFVLWAWWVKASWCGWKLVAWHWAVTVRMDEDAWRKREGMEKRRRSALKAEYGR